MGVTRRALSELHVSGNAWERSWGHWNLQVFEEGYLPTPPTEDSSGAADTKAQSMFQQLEVECWQNNDVMESHGEGRKNIR